METAITADEPVSFPVNKTTSKPLTEDWWAVILGGAIIFVVLLVNSNGIAFHLPSYQWSGLPDLWERFPKFVIGFIGVSLIFSFLFSPATVKAIGPVLNSLRTVWFALAFISIGLEAKFADLVKIQGGRPAATFVGAQIFNIFWTLLWAYLLFGGYIFPVPDFK